MSNFNQKGVAHVLLLIAAVGLVSFLLISSSASFGNNLFAKLYPKKEGFASEPIPTPTPIYGYTTPYYPTPVSPTPTPTPTPTGDTTPPTITLTSPKNNAYVKEGKITLKANASDNVGVSRVEFFVDGSLLSFDTTTDYGVTWDTPSLANGSSHTIFAKAYDIGNNSGTSNTNTVTVDKIPPTVSITNPANGGSVGVGSVVNISATASDNIGVSQVVFKVNNTKICTDKTAPYSCNWTVPIAPGVLYTLQAEATDVATNVLSIIFSVTSN